MTANPISQTSGNSPIDLIGEVDRIVDHVEDVLNGPASPALPTPEGQLLSFVVPVKDEEATIESLAEGVRAHIPEGDRYELVFVDDGSSDGSWQVILALCDAQPANIRGIRFRQNAGKAISLAAGFQAARGDLVFTMDADLQDDPREIPRFVSKIHEGFDLVSGWKRVRRDPWHKVLPSRVFNVVASALGGVKLHDHNCGYKCYRAEVVDRIKLHGELHRVIPSLANMHGFRCTEIAVRHHPRTAGRSKYGLERILRGLCDVTTTGFLRRFRQRPAHFFNAIAGLHLALAGCMFLVCFGQFADQLPASLNVLVGGIFLGLAGLSFSFGLIAELVIRGPLRESEELPIQFDTGILPPSDNPPQRRYMVGNIKQFTSPHNQPVGHYAPTPSPQY